MEEQQYPDNAPQQNPQPKREYGLTEILNEPWPSDQPDQLQQTGWIQQESTPNPQPAQQAWQQPVQEPQQQAWQPEPQTWQQPDQQNWQQPEQPEQGQTSMLQQPPEWQGTQQPEWQSPQPPQEEKPKKKKKGLLIGLIAGAAVLLLAGGVLAYLFLIAPSMKYQNAQAMLNAGQYDEAITAFASLGDYQDSAAMTKEAFYQKAKDLVRGKKYDEAIGIFESLSDYSDSQTQIREAKYRKAADLLAGGDYAGAIVAFSALGDYSDSAEQVKQAQYLQACDLLEAGDFAAASEAFTALGDYSDSVTRRLECGYQLAMSLYNSGDYVAASEAFAALGDYSDSADRRKECDYALAKSYYERGDYASALPRLEALGDYADSAAMCKNATFQVAVSDYAAHKYAAACAGFGKYPDDATFVTSHEACVKEWLEYLLANEESYEFPAEFAALKLTESEQATLYQRMVNYCDTADFYDVYDHVEILSGVCKLLPSGYENRGDYAKIFEELLKDTDATSFFQNVKTAVVDLWNTGFVHNIFSHHDYILGFLQGDWKTTDQVYHYSVDETGRATYNLPWIDSDADTYYRLENYEFLLYDSSTNEFIMRVFSFSMVAQGVIDVTCDKNGQTYRLYRQG